jgi:spore coat protein JB
MNAACNQNEKMRRLMAVSQYAFAISDITLFLDTHPKDQDALEYFHHMHHGYEKAVAEYESNFGPLTQTGEGNRNFWQWSTMPWPWERGYY